MFRCWSELLQKHVSPWTARARVRCPSSWQLRHQRRSPWKVRLAQGWLYIEGAVAKSTGLSIHLVAKTHWLYASPAHQPANHPLTGTTTPTRSPPFPHRFQCRSTWRPGNHRPRRTEPQRDHPPRRIRTRAEGTWMSNMETRRQNATVHRKGWYTSIMMVNNGCRWSFMEVK